MKVVRGIERMREISTTHRMSGESTALVPTMGALHEGHLDLVRIAGEVASRTIVSIFVNPTQFGPGEDLEAYPRDFEADLAALEPLGVDYVFNPRASDVYPDGYQTRVRVPEIERHLCGLSRPVHFSGVATVVLKLFNMCVPDCAVFGMKDFQQVRVIERMVTDMNLGVRIVRHPTVREDDGLAMSSRNRYLTPIERKRAPVLYATLTALKKMASSGVRDAGALVAEGLRRLADAGMDVEYLNVCDPDTLDDVSSVEGEILIAVAARLGAARLIDNVLVNPFEEDDE